MRLENWISVIAIVATLIAPFLPIWLQHKPAHRNKNLPASRRRKYGRWVRDLITSKKASFVFGILGLSNALAFLIIEVTSSDPLTRSTVFKIALYVSLIVIQLVFYAMMWLIGKIVDLQARFLDFMMVSVEKQPVSQSQSMNQGRLTNDGENQDGESASQDEKTPNTYEASSCQEGKLL